MGRRPLGKIDPSLDLSAYLYEIEQLPRPFDPHRFFGRTAPLEVEVGSGKGLFLQNAAESAPDTNFLGIELSRKYARFSAARLAQRQLTAGKVVHGDALRVFRELLPHACAAAVHIYFPDPWWKKRHKKRRVMTAEFARDVERVLEPQGGLHYWTDVEEYFQAARELIAAHTHLEGPLAVAERPAEHDLDYRTHFERRMRLDKETVYRAQYRKR